jgi:hypothetical protein
MSPQSLPPVPPPFTMPFYYSNLCNCAVYYLVDPSQVESYLKGTGLSVALFNGKAVVTYNFQLYSGQFSAGIDLPPDQWPPQCASITQELELSIVSYPTALESHLNDVDYEQFMLGGEQTKLLGNQRVHVPCDSDIAIAAGEKLFGEPKFKTSFGVNIASLNPVRAPGADYTPAWMQKWGFRVNDPSNAKEAIFTCVVDVTGLVGVPGSISPITEYGRFDRKLIGCRWELLGPMTTYFLTEAQANRVQLAYGTSKHVMKSDMKNLIGDAPASAVQTFVSAPAAIQSRAYYP